MAKLPIITTSGGVTEPIQSARINVGQIQRQGDEQQAGLLKFAEGAYDVAEKLKVARDAADGMTAAAEFGRTLDAYRVELDKDGDYATKAQRFQDYAQSELTNRVKGLDRRAADILTARLTPVAQAMEQSVRHGSRQDEIQAGIVKIRAANDDLLTQAGSARSDVERDSILAQIKGNIDTGLQTGLLKADQHQQLVKETLGKADQAYVLKLIGQNPGAAIALLSDPQRMRSLDPVQRERLADAARDEGRKNAALAIQYADREERRQDRVLRKASDEADKSIARMEADGTLTREAIDAMRPYLSANDYRAALRLQSGGAAVDKPEALAQLEPQLHQRDMKADLQKALLANDITGPTYRSMMERNQVAMKDDQPHSMFNTSREFINTALDPGAFGDARQTLPMRLARAKALREFDNWRRANTNARPEDIQAEASRTVDAYALIGVDQISQSLGLPRYANPNVTRQTFDLGDTAKALKEIDAAESATLGALDAKELDRGGFNDEMVKLKSWRAVLERRAAAEAAKAAKPQPQPGRR